jgi:hypothetical protein
MFFLKYSYKSKRLLHRLHSVPSAPWPRWVWRAGDARNNLGPHWKTLEGLLPLYRSITHVAISDGACTAFWLDDWLPGGALCVGFPALFSHVLRPEATVAAVLTTGIRSALVPRLSAAGATQLSALSALLAEVGMSPTYL